MNYSTPNHKQIVFIGAGNVATHLSKAVKKAGFQTLQVFSRSIDSAQSLALQLKCDFTTDITSVRTDADLYFFAVADDALPAILAVMPPNNGLWIHTAGSVPMDVFRGYTKRYGVLYPLQTFSKEREKNLSEVSLFIEANAAEDEELLCHLAGCLSKNVAVMSSEKRKYLHLAAVFACNFSNHLYTLAALILEKQGIDWRLLQPILIETVAKYNEMPPEKAQSGPAVRGDRTIIQQHLSMLEDEQMRNLYSLISESINKRCLIKLKQ